MTLTEQWEQAKRMIEASLIEGRLDPATAARRLAKLDYRIKRRPRILKRRQDRKAWQERRTADLWAKRNGVSAPQPPQNVPDFPVTLSAECSGATKGA
jgi:hypothetical protein